MIETLFPYGAIKESLVMKVIEKEGKYFLLDVAYNKYRISKETYNELKKRGH